MSVSTRPGPRHFSMHLNSSLTLTLLILSNSYFQERRYRVIREMRILQIVTQWKLTHFTEITRVLPISLNPGEIWNIHILLDTEPSKVQQKKLTFVLIWTADPEFLTCQHSAPCSSWNIRFSWHKAQTGSDIRSSCDLICMISYTKWNTLARINTGKLATIK